VREYPTTRIIRFTSSRFLGHVFKQLQRVVRSPAVAAMTLRSKILGSSNGETTTDESNSFARHAWHRLGSRIAYNRMLVQ
jgi:hypothetical protein